MTAAELRPVLMQSKRKPVSCAVGLTKDRQAVVLLDRKMKPRKLMAEFKSRAKGAGLELDMTSVRFGRVALQGEDGTAAFTVNKTAPKAMEVGLTRKLRPAGVRKVEIGVDAKLEDEDDAEDGQDAASAEDADGHKAAPGSAAGPSAAGAVGGAAAPPEPAGGEAAPAGGTPEPAGGGAGPAGGGAAQVGAAQGGPAADGGDTGPDADGAEGASADGPAGRGTPGVQAGPAGTNPRGGAADNPAGVPAGADPGAGAPGKAAVARRLAVLVQRMIAALPGNPPAAAAMRAAAVAGQAAVKSGDMAAAGQAADTLERLLGGTDGAETGGLGPGAAPAALATPGAASAQTANGRPAADGRASAQAGARPAIRHGNPVFEKGRASWVAVRAQVKRDIEAVVGKMGRWAGGDGDLKMLRDNFDPILTHLDDDLSTKLDEVARNPDGTAHAKLVGEAQEIIRRYTSYVDDEPAIALLDENPVHPVKVRKTLDAALAALSRVVGTSGGAAQPGAPAAAPPTS